MDDTNSSQHHLEKGMVFLKCEDYSSAIPIFTMLTDAGDSQYEANVALRLNEDVGYTFLYLNSYFSLPRRSLNWLLCDSLCYVSTSKWDVASRYARNAIALDSAKVKVRI